MRKLFWVCAAASVLAVFAGCSDDTGTKAAPPAANVSEVVNAPTFNEAIITARDTIDRDNAAVVLSEKARIGAVPSSQAGGRDLSTALVGTETTFNFDINGDGTSESVYVFIATVDEVTFIAWELSGVCNLGWIDGPLGYMLQAPCGGSGDLIACSHPVGQNVHACNVCRTGSCEACDVSDNRVDCPDDQPDPEPTPNPEPSLCDPPCSGGSLCRDGVCIDPDPDPNPDGEPDPDPGPFTSGQCNESCMSQSGAVCCTTCGCEGEIRCQPECGSGFQWDCEIGCCFDYDTFECECPSGSVYNGEKNCCEIDEGCLDL